jgi:magnesium transporter
VPSDRHIPHSVLRDASGRLTQDLPPREIRDAVADSGTRLWVDIDSTSRHQHAILEKLFHFHPLTVEDTLNPNSRVKIEAYDGYLFIVLRAVRFCDTTTDPYDLETENLYIYLGANYVVTVHSAYSQTIDAVADLIRRSPDLFDRGPARLAHTICDTAVDAFFPILDRVDEFVDGLESRVFERFDESALHDIFALKRTVLSLRRYLAPQREIFNVLTNRPTPLLPPESQLYFRDVYDHVLRINDSLDTFRELLSSTLDSYLTQVSNRLGTITKGLSVVATLSVPFVVISGMWGMNFAEIPLSRYPHGFWVMLVLQLALGIGLVAALRWKKFL